MNIASLPTIEVANQQGPTDSAGIAADPFGVVTRIVTDGRDHQGLRRFLESQGCFIPNRNGISFEDLASLIPVTIDEVLDVALLSVSHNDYDPRAWEILGEYHSGEVSDMPLLRQKGLVGLPAQLAFYPEAIKGFMKGLALSELLILCEPIIYKKSTRRYRPEFFLSASGQLELCASPDCHLWSGPAIAARIPASSANASYAVAA